MNSFSSRLQKLTELLDQNLFNFFSKGLIFNFIDLMFKKKLLSFFIQLNDTKWTILLPIQNCFPTTSISELWNLFV